MQNKCQNELLWTTKHVFLHDYFLHIWHVLGAKFFEFNAYKQLANWYKKLIFSLATIWLKISSLSNFDMIFFQVHPMNMYLLKNKHVFLAQQI